MRLENFFARCSYGTSCSYFTFYIFNVCYVTISLICDKGYIPIVNRSSDFIAHLKTATRFNDVYNTRPHYLFKDIFRKEEIYALADTA